MKNEHTHTHSSNLTSALTSGSSQKQNGRVSRTDTNDRTITFTEIDEIIEPNEHQSEFQNRSFVVNDVGEFDAKDNCHMIIRDQNQKKAKKYSAFTNFGTVPKFGHFWRFSE